MKPRIVLVRPQMGENIGFVVRLAENFGLDPIHLVLPEPGWERGAAKTASMSRDLLSQTRLHEEVGTAVADTHHVFAFTARSGRERELRPVIELGERIVRIEGGEACSFLFGNEANGLARLELELCTDLFRIDVPGLSSFNLSHAVAIAIQESQRGAQISAELSESVHPLITAGEKQRLAQRATDVLARIDFPTEDPHFKRALERLLLGGKLQSRDARMLHRILKHIDYTHGQTDLTHDSGSEQS